MSGPVIGKADFTLQRLYGLYKANKLVFNTEYQRSFIWKNPKRQLLLDSIMRDYDINKLFLRQMEDGSYECLDGQQRLRSIFLFMDPNDGFALGERSRDLGLEGKTIQDLEAQFQQFYYKLLYYKTDAVVVFQADEETVSDIFLRLQEGIPLNSAEKLNSMRGFLRNRVVEFSKEPLWANLGIDNYRFAHRYLCAQIASLELANVQLPDDGFHIRDVKYANIRLEYEKYKNVQPPNRVLNDVFDTLGYLNKSLGDKARIIAHKSDVIPVYLLASYLLKRYASVKQNGDRFSDFVSHFLAKAYSTNDSPYAEYRNHRSKSVESRKSVQEGFKIVLGKFLEFAPDLLLKDNKRLFDYGQRLAIYYRDGGRCQGGKHQGDSSIRFDEGEYHHIKPWGQGGITTVSNGVLLCHDCHAHTQSQGAAS